MSRECRESRRWNALTPEQRLEVVQQLRGVARQHPNESIRELESDWAWTDGMNWEGQLGAKNIVVALYPLAPDDVETIMENAGIFCMESPPPYVARSKANVRVRFHFTPDSAS